MEVKIISLSKNIDFKSILNGKKITNYYSTIFFRKIFKNEKSKVHLSIIVNKKLGKAIQRNKIKRRLKNIMRFVVKNININLEYSFLVIAKKTVLENKYDDIKDKLFKDFKKIK